MLWAIFTTYVNLLFWLKYSQKQMSMDCETRLAVKQARKYTSGSDDQRWVATILENILIDQFSNDAS